MNQIEKAIALFDEGHSCSQAIFAAFAPPLGLDESMALRITCPFGGGIARTGDMCGAVSGALVTIGLKYGRVAPDDDDAREKTYELVNVFLERFKSIHGQINCRDLIEYDLGIPAEHDEAEAKGLFTTKCTEFVKNAAEILDSIL